MGGGFVNENLENAGAAARGRSVILTGSRGKRQTKSIGRRSTNERCRRPAMDRKKRVGKGAALRADPNASADVHEPRGVGEAHAFDVRGHAPLRLDPVVNPGRVVAHQIIRTPGIRRPRRAIGPVKSEGRTR